jgi:hypothetical protein
MRRDSTALALDRGVNSGEEEGQKIEEISVLSCGISKGMGHVKNGLTPSRYSIVSSRPSE